MVADDVVGRGVLLDAIKGGRKVVGIEEGLAAGVGGERGHHFLGVEVGVEIVLQRRAVEGAGAAQAAGGGVAERRDRLQAARVDGVDGHVGAHRGVDGRVQRSLVLNAVALDASGEIEQRFLLVEVGERLRNVFDGEELAVGIDVVVLRLVGREGSGVFHLIGGAGGSRVKSRALGAGVGVHGVQQQMLIGGEVLIERERLVEGDDRDQVRRMHLLVDVIAGGILRAIEIVGLHRRDVEEHHDQPMIAQLLPGWRAGSAPKIAVGRVGVDGGLIERRGLVDVLKVEADDLLRLAILLNLEILFGETLHHLAGLLVAHHDVGEHQIAVDLEGVGGLRIGLRRILVLRVIDVAARTAKPNRATKLRKRPFTFIRILSSP